MVGESSRQLAARYLAGRTHRQPFQDMDVPRHLERRQTIVDEIDELRRRRLGIAVKGERGADLLAEPRMRHGEARRLAHRGMAEQRLLDVVGRYLLAAAIDDLLGTTDDPQEAAPVD